MTLIQIQISACGATRHHENSAASTCEDRPSRLGVDHEEVLIEP